MYVVCFLFELVGLMFGEPQDTYVTDVIGLVIQLTIITLIPNLIYLIKLRKEDGAIIGFIGILPLVFIPYAVFAVILTELLHL